MQIVAGVDCHKGSHAIVFVDAVGKLLEELTIAATASGYAQAIVASRRLGEIIWGLEGTGFYGRGFADALIASGAVVYEVPAPYTKRHRAHASRHGKSDRNDALAIAQAVLREHERLPRFRVFDEQEALRLRRDQHDRLVRERTRQINRLRAAAVRLGLVDLPRDLTCTASLEAIVAAAQSLRGRSYAADALIDDIVFATQTITHVSTQLTQVDQSLRPLTRRLAPELLALYGVSDVVAAGLIGHAGDLRNCRNADAFAMRSATAPLPYASGKHQHVRVNHGGNRQLNRNLHSVALRQRCAKAHPGRTYYERKIQEGKTPRAAMRALKRRLATVVYFRLRAMHQRLEAQKKLVAA